MRILSSMVPATFVVALAHGTTQPRAEEQSLDQAANDPTASLMAFQLQDFFTPTFHDLSGVDQNAVQFRAAIPFSTGNLNHIARITVPYFTTTPAGKAGLSDTTLFDLVVFNQPWGRYGIGAVALLPTGHGPLSADKCRRSSRRICRAVGPVAVGRVQPEPFLGCRRRQQAGRERL